MSDAASAPEPVRESWHHRLRQGLRRIFCTRHRAATVEETRLRAEVATLLTQLAEREADLRRSANDLETSRAHAKLLEMELTDFVLLRSRTRAQWEADLTVEARRAAGPDRK